jgi:hypothetical protein
MSQFSNNEKALDELTQAWSVLTFVRQSLNEIDGDEVPFSASALELTIQAAEDKCGAVHEYFEAIENARRAL